MQTFKFGVLAALGVLAACATEQEQAQNARENLQETRQEAAQNVQEAEQAAREDVAKAVQEGREDVAEARKDLAQELRDQEKSGEEVEFTGVVTGHDADTVMLRLENGETFEVDYNPNSKFRRGNDVVMVTDLTPGTMVDVTYRIQDGKRIIDEIDVNEGRAPNAPDLTPRDDVNQPGMGGGTK